MGVAIMMIAGRIGQRLAEEVNITPGFRADAAKVLRHYWSESPIVLTLEADGDRLRAMADACTVHALDRENFWKQIADAVDEHGAVTITLEY